MPCFWLSFADADKPPGTQFLGAALVEAKDFLSAVKAARVYGCNPGGEVQGVELDSALYYVPESYQNRLMSESEARALTGAEFLRPEHQALSTTQQPDDTPLPALDSIPLVSG